ncbi:MAG: hypothetical protein JWM68_4595, partial [Verrucomicrobiales bacterium]|nr:hypothetical protein [Verrucomicrobiales bacterium]
LRMRERETGLQQQTRLLDEQKGDAENYKKRVETLSSSQKSISEELVALKDQNKIPILVRTYTETESALSAVHDLLVKPQTDNMTVDAQSKSIELFTDLINLINEQAQRNPPPKSGDPKKGDSEDMAFLMKMMAQKPQVGKGMPMKAPGGGNTSGGSTDQVPGRANGNALGKQGVEKTVQKASGASSISLPVEFREQLEDYFKAVEQETESTQSEN